MINLSKAYFVLFCLLAISQLLSPAIFQMADELVIAAMAMLAGVDMLYNRTWRNYKAMIVPALIITAYAIYSVAIKSNETVSIRADYIFHLKPVICSGVAYGLAPKFSFSQRQIVKYIFIAISIAAVAMYATLLTGSMVFYDLLIVPYYVGCVTLCAGLTFLLFIDNDSKVVVRRNLLQAILLLALGLVCTRSKYYGALLFIAFMVVVYRPGFFARMSLRNITVCFAALLVLAAVSWSKFQFYFVQGGIAVNEFDDSSTGMFARSALYLGMFFVLSDYFWLGSGLGTYATQASNSYFNYSDLYYQYDLDKIYGLSPDFDAFVGDTFFPELAQFGIVGIVLFVMCMAWLFKKACQIHRIGGILPAVVVVSILVSLLIDAIASRAIVSSMGEYLFALAGLALAPCRTLSSRDKKEMLRSLPEGCTTLWTRVFNRKCKEKMIYGK